MGDSPPQSLMEHQVPVCSREARMFKSKSRQQLFLPRQRVGDRQQWRATVRNECLRIFSSSRVSAKLREHMCRKGSMTWYGGYPMIFLQNSKIGLIWSWRRIAHRPPFPLTLLAPLMFDRTEDLDEPKSLIANKIRWEWPISYNF